MKKRFFLTLAIIFVFAWLFALSISAEVYEGVDYTLNANAKTAQVSNVNKTMTTEIVTIPSEITIDDVTYTVTSIANNAFEGNTTMKELRILSEHITVIPYGMILSTNGTLEKIYVDFSNIVTINQAGFNPLSAGNGNNNYAVSSIYFYDAKAFIEKGEDVVITSPDFSNCTSIGQAAFQSCNFKNIVIPATTSLSSQIFRHSTIETVIIKGENRERLETYVFNNCDSLTSIVVESRNLKYVGNSAFGDCGNVQSIEIDLSKCTQIGGSAFALNDNYQNGATNTWTKWYNLDKERVIDIRNVTIFETAAFGNCNLGGGTEENLWAGETTIIWPQALTRLDDQVFRRCNITGTIYINAAEGSTLTINSWIFRGNKPNVVIFGEGVATMNGSCFASNGDATNGSIAQGAKVVFLADSVDCKDSNLFKDASGVTLYCKALTTNTSFSQATINTISEGEAIYSVCGVTANLTLAADSSKVTIGEVVHKYSSKGFDNTYCPINTYTKYVCVTCALEQYKDLEENIVDKSTLAVHVFDFDNGDKLVSVSFVDNNFLANGIKTVCCDNCTQVSTEEEATFPALFISYGYSHAYENGKGALMQSVGINKEAFQQYKALNPEMSISYGVVAASGANPIIYTAGSFIDKAVVVDFTNRFYDIMEIKIYGISEATAQTELYCCGYIIIDGEITYIDNGALSDTAQTKSYSDYGTEFNTVEPVEAIVPTKETYSQVA
ncbi:MAG: leucine-rich repeat protein [Clostridia bacterium]|nr:leucine-rich repeat protein [Clostridia bacterium]